MSLGIIGAAVLVLCIVAYAMSYNTEPQVDLHDPKVFQERKDLYRKQRDDFRSNFRVMEELVQWKAKNNDYEYRELYVHPYVPLRCTIDNNELQNISKRARSFDWKGCMADRIIALAVVPV